MSEENFRFPVKVCTALNIPRGVTYDELCSFCDDEAPYYAIVKILAK